MSKDLKGTGRIRSVRDLPDWLFMLGRHPDEWMQRGERPNDRDHGSVAKAWLQQNAAALVQDRELPVDWHAERKARRKQAALDWDRVWDESWILPPGVADLPQADPGGWENLPVRNPPPVRAVRILDPDITNIERDTLTNFYNSTGQSPPRRGGARP